MLRSLGRTVAGLLVITLVAAGCANSSDEGSTTTEADAPAQAGTGSEETRDEFVELDVPGVSDEEIAFDVVGTKTGNPLGICILDCYVQGIQAYFDYRNSEGGIYGRDLVLNEVLDDELSQNQQKSLDVIAADDAFGVFQATLLATGWGDLEDAGIPTYTWGIHSTEAANRSHIFPSLVARCADCPRPTIPYVASQAGATKAASLGYGVSENSKVCTNTNAEAFELYEEDSGVELAYTNDDLDYGLPNGIGPQVTEMKKAGVDFITTCIDLNGMRTLAEELSRQGMDDVVLYHPNSYDQGAIAEAGELFEGDVVGVLFRPFEVDAEGTSAELFQEWMAKAGNEPTELAMVGWINAQLAYDGLLAAGPEFDREAVTGATNALTDYTGGGILEPVDWTRAHTPYTNEDDEGQREDQECAAFVTIEGGEFTAYDSTTEPWLCWDDDRKVDFEPTAKNFD